MNHQNKLLNDELAKRIYLSPETIQRIRIYKAQLKADELRKKQLLTKPISVESRIIAIAFAH